MGWLYDPDNHGIALAWLWVLACLGMVLFIDGSEQRVRVALIIACAFGAIGWLLRFIQQRP
jgi:hypothetical protein